MSHPLCAIGGAVLEVIGLNPQGIAYRSDATWARQDVFDGRPDYQPTGMGESTFRLRLAARPHVMGGLGAYAILKAHHEARDVVDFIRLGAGYAGDVGSGVAITRLGHEEQRIAPDGVGRRHEFDVELTVVDNGTGGFL